jgi:hypothetical protein
MKQRHTSFRAALRALLTAGVGAIAFALILAACAGGPAAAGADSQDELDAAVREASDYLNANLPRGSRLVILNVRAMCSGSILA